MYVCAYIYIYNFNNSYHVVFHAMVFWIMTPCSLVGVEKYFC